MSEVTATAGTSSTPATSEPIAAPAATAPAATTTVTTEPTTASPAASTTEPSKTAGSTEPAKTESAGAEPPDPIAFTLPDDLKIADEAQTKFKDFLKTKVTDGKLTLSAQEVVDLYADQARAAYSRWEKQQTDLNAANEAECKQRFTPQQLAASETGVGFLSSFDPQFREVAKAFLNNPTFVNAMRVVGERLSEDSFEIGSARPEPARRQAKDVLYGKRN